MASAMPSCPKYRSKCPSPRGRPGRPPARAIRLKPEVRRNLDNAARLQTRHARIADRRRNLTEGRARNIRIRVSELRLIEHVERIAAQLHIEALADFEVFRDRQIEIHVTGA